MGSMRRFYPILFLGVLAAAVLPAESPGTVETSSTATFAARGCSGRPPCRPGPGGIPRLVLTDLLAAARRGPVCSGGGVASQIQPASAPDDLIFFDPEPVTVGLRYKGPLHFHNLTLPGDVEEIEIQLTEAGALHRFERVDSRMLDGNLVSVFEVTLPYSDLRDQPQEIRFDHATVPRLRPTTIPRSRVVRINDRVQYSSHVVNIVYDWDSAVMMNFPGREIAQIFYEHFSDTYEELAFVPVRQYFSHHGASHVFVSNSVGGIGLPEESERSLWSNSQTLEGAIVYHRGDMPWNYLSLHETAHQWAFFFDLFDVAGIENTGRSTCGARGHVPLAADQPSHLSRCLIPPLRIERRAGRWVLSEAPPPLEFHPWVLYTMGLLPADEVPPLHLGTEQGLLPSHRPGREVPGSFVEVSIDDVIARYGPREGPAAPPVWRRANIIVSPDRLLSKKDMRWYNFHARRISDPEVTGVEDLDGIPSLEFATQGMMDLRTEIRPRGRAAVRGNFGVSYPSLGKRDIRGLTLDRKLGTRFEAGSAYVLSGRARSPAGRESVTVAIDEKTFSGAIGPDRRFAVEILPTPEDRGPRTMSLWLGDRERLLATIAPVYVE